MPQQTVGCNKRSALHRSPSDPRESVQYGLTPYCTLPLRPVGLAANGAHFSNVIPAPLAREAGERDQAGTQSTSKQGFAIVLAPRGSVTSIVRPKSKLPGAWVPAWSRSGLSGPSGAGMTSVE
jgi:hypothetical protein